MPFPVLRLCSDEFDNVYQFLDVSDIILVSQCSKRMKDLVKSQESPRRRRVLNVKIFPKEATVNVCHVARDGKFNFSFSWHILSQNQDELADIRQFVNRYLDGATWKVSGGRDKFQSVILAEFYEKNVVATVTMLQDLFNCPIDGICLYDQIDFQKFLVDSNILHQASSIVIDRASFTPEQMDFMFDNFITDNFWFGGTCFETDYCYQRPLNFPRITIYKAPWINSENLMAMVETSKNIDLRFVRLITDKDLNNLIKWWIGSDNRTLESAEICRNLRNRGDEWKVPVIMKRIQSTPGSKKRREAITDSMPHYRYENGRDIRRADGLLATVIVAPGEFALIVWYHPNPNVDN